MGKFLEVDLMVERIWPIYILAIYAFLFQIYKVGSL